MKMNLRILLPWFTDKEAVSAILGFRMPAGGEDLSAATQLLEAQRECLRARAPLRPSRPIEPLPREIAAAGEAAFEVYRSLDPCPRPARAGVVDLSQLISFQRSVLIDGIEERVAAAREDDWEDLAALTLPPFEADDDLIKGTFDGDGKGVTLISTNPNLRTGPVQMMRGPTGKVVGFSVLFGLPYLRVAEYEGRWFLLDGYHRAYGLLARGIRRVPCLYERATSLTDFTAGALFRIPHEHLSGPRPPMVSHFLEPDLSLTVQIAAFRKVVRIRADEFNVDQL